MPMVCALMTLYTSMYHFQAQRPLVLGRLWSELLTDHVQNLFQVFARRAD